MKQKLKRSGLIPRRILLFFCCIQLLGCTEKITTYSPDEGEIQWALLDKNSTKGVAFFVRAQNDTLAAIASAEVVTKFGELGYYKFIDISLAGLEQDTTRVDVILTDKGHNQEFHFVKSNWESAMLQLRAIENMDDTLSVVLTCERQYKLSSLPAKLQLNYKIATQDTLVTGSTSFKAVVTETPGVLRWH